MAVCQKELSNALIDAALPSLKRLSERSDVIGYAAARNYRTMADAIREFYQLKDGIAKKYGKPVLDDDGNETGEYHVPIDCPAMNDIFSAMMDTQKLDVYSIPAADALNKIPGQDIINLDFMFDGAWDIGTE